MGRFQPWGMMAQGSGTPITREHIIAVEQDALAASEDWAAESGAMPTPCIRSLSAETRTPSLRMRVRPAEYGGRHAA